LGAIPKDLLTNVWEFNPVLASQVGHLAPFPHELPKRLISLYSFEDDTVLDPFVGSGSVMEVARSLGRNSIGYELMPEYCKLIKDNLFGQQTLGSECEYTFVERKGDVNVKQDGSD
jgi:site-specific DNA-methyltransferase (adenine-specific)